MDTLASLPADNQTFLKLWSDNDFWQPVAREILQDHGLESEPLYRATEGSNIVFQVGEDKYLKILDPSSSESYPSEVAGLKYFQDKLSVETPRLIHHAALPTQNWAYVLMTKLDGELVSECFAQLTRGEKLSLMKELGKTARDVHSIPIGTSKWTTVAWQNLMQENLAGLEQRHTSQKLPSHLLSQVRSFVEPRFDLATTFAVPVLLTGEYTPFNIFVSGAAGQRRLSGMFDFGDLMIGRDLYDLLGPMTFMAAGGKEMLRALLFSYGFQEGALDDQLRETFMTLLLLHRFSNLNGQIRMSGWQDARNFEEVAQLVFCF